MAEPKTRATDTDVDAFIEAIPDPGQRADAGRLVEMLADVEKHEDFIVRLTSHDLYEGIDLACDKMARQLTDFKERLKNSKH